MQPFLCHRAGEVHRLLNRQCDMQVIQVGQVQPSVLSKVETAVKNLKKWLSAKKQLLWLKSEQNELCRILCVPVLFSPIAPLIWAAVIGLVVMCGLAEWLEGGTL